MSRLDATIPLEELERVVKRLLSSCTRQGDCLVHPVVNAQLRVRIDTGVYGTVSATRAIWRVSRATPLLDEENVERSCSNRRCLEPDHLVKRKNGDHPPERRVRMIAANREASIKRRKYSDEQIGDFFCYLNEGKEVAVAASRADIPRMMGFQLVAGRARNPGIRKRTFRRGTPDNQQCTRCSGFGHRRNHKKCPQHPRHQEYQEAI